MINMDQNILAKKTGLTEKSISQIVTSKVLPRKANLKLIAQALDCDIANFFVNNENTDEYQLNSETIKALQKLAN